MSDPTRRLLVTDAGRGSALAFIRSLGQRGWHITAADADRHSPGFRSRFTTDRLVYPDPRVDAAAAVETVLGAIRDRGVDLVVPVTDEIGLPLAAARDRIDDRVRVALPGPEALAATHDKARTLELAARLAVPTPPTVRAATAEDAIAAAADLGWPVVVKPQTSRERRDDGAMEAFTVAYAGDSRTLRERVEALGGRTGVLLQRWRPGEGHGIEMLAFEGRPLAAFQHRRLREVPVTGGASALRESVALDPVLFGHACRLLAALRWTGLAMVEFRLTPDGPELMEINGRVWGSLPLAVRAGMDFPGRLADLLLDGPPDEDTPPATGYRIGVRARNLRLEVSWIGAVTMGRRRYPELPWPARSAAVGAALSLLDPRIDDDHFVRGDLGPGLARGAGIGREAIRKAGRHAR
ncbi:MAG: ATP-grasp domain-containing protein [Candidatus Limnocylindrales bacterium]